MNKLLKITGLCKSFQSGSDQLQILLNLALEVEQGQMVAVTGASGSGKSTFLHLVGGMERADAGEIRLEGTDVTELVGSELASYRNQKIGFIFQFHHLLPEFSALENVMFPLLLRGQTFGQASEEANSLMGEVGLGDRVHHKPGELSGGEQQRVAVARALVGRPQLLLGDEPTGNLDEHTAETLYQLLGEIHLRHKLTSIIVTHNPRLASQCDVEKRLHDGQLV
jgi:lipoprotein-releasing system ATP-binding protein